MLRGFLIFLAILGMGTVANAVEWKVFSIQGRDYLGMDNIARFYGMTRTVATDRAISLRSPRGYTLQGEAGSKELYINQIKFILSYPIETENGELLLSRMDLSKVVEPVLRPSKISGANGFDTVVLDAGHGGHDQGATSLWGAEKNFALDVVFRARKLLQTRGYKVVLTRSSDVFIPLEDRVRIANQYAGGVFVSVHFNAGNSPATGLETFTLAPRGVPSTAADGPAVSDFRACAGNIRDQENMALATATHAAMLARLGMFDRGIKRARFVVIRDIRVPGVLVEGGFLSNTNDSRRVASTTYRQQMAEGIVDALVRYKRATSMPTVPTIAGVPPTSEAESSKQASVAPDVAQPPNSSSSDGPVVVVPTAN